MSISWFAAHNSNLLFPFFFAQARSALPALCSLVSNLRKRIMKLQLFVSSFLSHLLKAWYLRPKCLKAKIPEASHCRTPDNKQRWVIWHPSRHSSQLGSWQHQIARRSAEHLIHSTKYGTGMGDQRGWMRADKNSSREHDLCPKSN